MSERCVRAACVQAVQLGRDYAGLCRAHRRCLVTGLPRGCLRPGCTRPGVLAPPRHRRALSTKGRVPPRIDRRFRLARDPKSGTGCRRRQRPTVTARWASRQGPLRAVESRLGRRTVLTVPLLPPPQKNRSPPSNSSPDTATPAGISSLSRTSPVAGSTRLRSLSSPCKVPCQSSPSIQVTPVTKRFDSIVRRTAPVSGST